MSTVQEPKRIKFTRLAVERLPLPERGRVTYWDALLPSFGLRVSARGRKTWIAVYRVNGKQKWETLGTLARIPRPDDARDRARQSFEAAARGENPVRAVVQERVVAEQKVAEEQTKKIVTFGLAVEIYLKESKTKDRLNTFKAKRDVLYRSIKLWGDRPVDEVTKREIDDWIKRIATGPRLRARHGQTEGAGPQANNTLAKLRTFFNWALDKDLIVVNPTERLRRPAEESERDRVLSEDEIRLVWRACDDIGYPFGRAAQLMLLTAQRKSEVAGLPWSELNMKKCRWMLPKRRAKNKRAHIVPLSKFVMEIIEQLPHIGATYLFTDTGNQPVYDFQYAKERLDRLILAKKPDIERWTFHDLRRTATTGMAEELKIAPHVVDKILNHFDGTIKGVARIYNRSQYLDERTEALEKWADYVKALVE